MKTAIICALGALALTACQRPAEETTTDETPMADAAAMDEATPSDAGAATASTGSATRSSSSADDAATAAGDASADTVGMAPANEGMSTSGVSQATRDAAKEKAEETNLHP